MSMTVPGPSNMRPIEVLVGNFLSLLQTQLRTNGLPEPNVEIKKAIVALAERVLAEDIPEVPTPPTPHDDFDIKRMELGIALTQARAYDPKLIQAGLTASVLEFLKAIPQPEHALWEVRASEVMPVGSTIVNMVMPFYKTKPLGRSVIDRYEQGARIAMEKQKKKEWVWPQFYDGPDVLNLYLIPELQALFHCKVPFGLEQETRFRHQWVMASPGMGKTTLLSAQIYADLERVKANECSLFILDSQNKELGRFLPRLKEFAPGGPLHDKLIYLEPNEQHPLALNPFDFQGTNMRAVEQMVFFFMSTFSDETSGHMRNIVRFCLHALSRMESPTIFTFKELLKKKTYEGLEKEHPRLVELRSPRFKDIREFLVTGMFEGGYVSTIGAVKARLDFVTSDPLFRDMFSSKKNKFDLRTQLQSSKVIIINTRQDILHEGIEAFGRYFIGRLLQASEERGSGEANLPVFVTIDECHDYVARDRNIADLFFQARKQSIGLCVAHHDLSQIKVPEAQAAFRSAAIQAQPVEEGVFNFSIAKRGMTTTRVPPDRFFSRMPQMSRPEWDEVLRLQRNAFCHTPADDEEPVHNDTFDEE